ncbi:MAG: hypothetical protein M9949_14235 [Candidatus Kapabacteria bacterium]|nr:hypothetical protein [Candidatus Kapabacteria bacterium]
MKNLRTTLTATFEWETEEYNEQLDDFQMVTKSCEYSWEIEIENEWGIKEYCIEIHYVSGDSFDEEIEEKIRELVFDEECN